ncbi:MAG: molybdopterin-guanine dinucleotide biosynthesis protein B [Candidatus Bathyarchaeia archaeon]
MGELRVRKGRNVLMFLVINVVGIERNSGKTRLIEGLARELTKRDYRVATIKHIFEGTFDTAHKDTWKHLQAGANPIIVVSPKELISIKTNTDPSLHNALQEVPREVDVVLVEGFKKADNPKILAVQSLSQVEELMELVTQTIAISGPITSKKDCPSSVQNTPILELDELVTLVERLLLNAAVKRFPELDCKRCGYKTCNALATAVLEGKASINQCKTLAESDVVLTVDGKPIALSEFPKKFVRNTLLGMIKTLRGVNEAPSTISLEIGLD